MPQEWFLMDWSFVFQKSQVTRLYNVQVEIKQMPWSQASALFTRYISRTLVTKDGSICEPLVWWERSVSAAEGTCARISLMNDCGLEWIFRKPAMHHTNWGIFWEKSQPPDLLMMIGGTGSTLISWILETRSFRELRNGGPNFFWQLGIYGGISSNMELIWQIGFIRCFWNSEK